MPTYEKNPSIQLRPDRVAASRVVLGLDSDVALAEAMGTSRASVSRVITGGQPPSALFIAKLSVALDVSVQDLIEVVR